MTKAMARGYFGIGIEHGKDKINLGTLWRSAGLFGAAFIFTIGKRYTREKSDTYNTAKHVPLFHYDSLSELILPEGSALIGVELDTRSVALETFSHPTSCIYLLGAEDVGISNEARDKCDAIIQLPGKMSMNVATAGSIVLYDRHLKSLTRPAR